MADKQNLTLKKIRKRDGRIVDLDEKKIKVAILKAMRSVGEADENRAGEMAGQVTAFLEKRFDGHTIPAVEEIQDILLHKD